MEFSIFYLTQELWYDMLKEGEGKYEILEDEYRTLEDEYETLEDEYKLICTYNLTVALS